MTAFTGDAPLFNGKTPRGTYIPTKPESEFNSAYDSHAYGPRLVYRFLVAPNKECYVAAGFAETWAPNGKVGGRVMNVSIGGEVVQENFDVYVAAGNLVRKVVLGQFFATDWVTVARRFVAPADGIVEVVVESVSGDPNAMISQIDIWGGDNEKAEGGCTE